MKECETIFGGLWLEIAEIVLKVVTQLLDSTIVYSIINGSMTSLLSFRWGRPFNA